MKSWFRIIAFVGALPGALLAAGTSIAEEKPAPKGSVMLTIAGKIGNWNRGAVSPATDKALKDHQISFDKAMAFDADTLASMPVHELRVTMPGGESTFGGPLLSEVLKAAGVEGATVKLLTQDGSTVELTAEDVKTRDWILALLVDGKPIGAGDFGPIWLLHKPENGAMPSKEELQAWVPSVFYIEVI